MQRPILTLTGNYANISENDFITGGSFDGLAYRWEVTFTFTAQLHGYFDEGLTGEYNTSDLVIGDWICNSAGQVVQIVSISLNTGSSITAVVEDINFYNISKSEINEGFTTSGSVIAFKAKDGEPLVDPLISSSLSSTEYAGVVSRFEYFKTAISAVSQLANDVGYITEASAVTLVTDLETSILANGFVSAQQVEDAIDARGYITEASAQALVDAIDTNVQATNIGSGEQVAVQTSGIETTYRTILAEGGIELSASPTELVFSAAPNPVNLSELANDVGYITETSATTLVNELETSILANGFVSAQEVETAIDNRGYITEASVESLFAALSASDVSALSQFINDAGYVTVETATSVISQLVNDAGYITETSAVTLVTDLETSILANGFVSAQQVEDAIDARGYITEASAQSLVDAIDTNVQATNIGAGAQVAVATSSLETTYRTLVAEGGIELSASPTELVFSAAPNPVNLSELTNDVGYITEASVESLFAALSASDVSALSQFINDAGYVTVETATSVISQLVNDAGYITETSAVTLVSDLETSILANGFVSAQQVEDAIDARGYITEASAQSLVDAINVDVATSATGAGETLTVTTSGTETTFKTVIGGGSVDVSTTVDNEIKVSSNSTITVEVNSSVVSTEVNNINFTSGLINSPPLEINNNGLGQVNVTMPGIEVYEFDINFSGGEYATTDAATNLPAGWTFTRLNSDEIQINHNVGKRVLQFITYGLDVDGYYKGISGQGSLSHLRYVPATETASFVFFVSTPSRVLTTNDGTARVVVFFL